MRLRRKNRVAVLNSGTGPPPRPTRLIFPPYPSAATTCRNPGPATVSTTRSTLRGSRAPRIVLGRSGSPGSKTKPAPSSFRPRRLSGSRWKGKSLRDFEPPKLQPVAADLGKVILGLLHKPAFLGAAENLREPHGHFGRYAALPVCEF